MQKTESNPINDIDNILLKQQVAKELYSYKDINEIVTYNKVVDVLIIGGDLEHNPVRTNSQLQIVVLMDFDVSTEVKSGFPKTINNSRTAQSGFREYLPEEFASIKCVGIMNKTKLRSNTVYKQGYSLSHEKFKNISLDP